MRRVLVLLAVCAALFAPGMASARRVERYCTEFDMEVYGRQVVAVPETCFDCPYMVCSWLPAPAPPPPPGMAGAAKTLPVQIHIH